MLYTPKDSAVQNKDEERQIELRAEGGEILPEYFRFGYMAGSSSGDFSKAGIWDDDGEWSEMEEGPS